MNPPYPSGPPLPTIPLLAPMLPITPGAAAAAAAAAAASSGGPSHGHTGGSIFGSVFPATQGQGSGASAAGPSAHPSSSSSYGHAVSADHHSSAAAAASAADKKRDAVLWDMSMSWPAAFAAWHAGLQRERLLSAARHADLVRLLTGGATDSKRQGQLRTAQRAGYFVAQGADGRQQLYIRLQLQQLPSGSGKTPKATKGKGKMKGGAGANAEGEGEGDASGSDAALHLTGPLLVSDGSDPNAVSAAWEARAAAAAAVAAAQAAAAGPSGAAPWPSSPAATTTTVRLVLSAAEVPGVMASTHEANHAGSRVLYLDLSSRFHAIPRIACEALVSRCPHCRAKAARLTRAQQLMQQSDVGGDAAAAVAAAAAASAADSMKAEDAAAMGARFPFSLHPSLSSMLLKRPASVAGLGGGMGGGYGLGGGAAGGAGGMPSVAEVLAAAANANGTMPITKRPRYAGLDGSTAVAMSAYLQAHAAANASMAAPHLFMPMPMHMLPATPSSAPPQLLSATHSAPDSNAVSIPASLVLYWNSELRDPLRALLLRSHPASSPVVSDVLLASTVHRRALPITPLALEELSRALLELLQRIIVALDLQVRSHANKGAGSSADDNIEAWLAAALERLTGASLLGHRMERDARRSNQQQQSQGDATAPLARGNRSATSSSSSAASSSDPSSSTHHSVSVALVRFAIDQLVQNADMRSSYPHVAAKLLSSSPNGDSSIRTMAAFVSSVLDSCAVELLEAGGWMARSRQALALQSCHLLECVSAQADLRALWTRASLPLFSALPVADLDQIWPATAEAQSEAESEEREGDVSDQESKWWSAGAEQTEARMEAALDCIRHPEGGGYPDTFVRYGIVPLRRRVYQTTDQVDEDASMDSAAGASQPPLDEKVHQVRFAAFAASQAPGSGAASSSSAAAPSLLPSIVSSPRGQRRVLADLEVVDRAGNVLPLRIDCPLPGQDSGSAGGATVVGLITHRGTGRMMGEVFATGAASGAEGSQRSQLALVFGHAAGQAHADSYVQPASLPSEADEQALRNSRVSGAAAASEEGTVPLSIPCYVRTPDEEVEGALPSPLLSHAAAASSSRGPPSVPSLARVLRRALELALEGAEDEHSDIGGLNLAPSHSSAIWSSAQPLPLRVELRLRMLQRDGVAALDHPLARRPDLLRIVAEYDPAYLPHHDESLPKLLQHKRHSRTSAALTR